MRGRAQAQATRERQTPRTRLPSHAPVRACAHREDAGSLTSARCAELGRISESVVAMVFAERQSCFCSFQCLADLGPAGRAWAPSLHFLVLAQMPAGQ